MSGRLEGRLALVTGASRGIGAAIAKRFAKEGAEVILVARTQGALEEIDDAIRAEGGKAILAPQDLTKYDEVDAMAGGVFQRFGKLDILVGNAAKLGGLSPLGHYTPKSWDSTIATNITANYRLVRAFDPLLRQSPAGRAIFVTSGVTQGAAPYWGLYAATKAALEAMITSYAAEITQTKVKANLVDPGIVATRMREEAFPGEDQNTLKKPDDITDVFVALAEASCVRNGEIVKA